MVDSQQPARPDLRSLTTSTFETSSGDARRAKASAPTWLPMEQSWRMTMHG